MVLQMGSGKPITSKTTIKRLETTFYPKCTAPCQPIYGIWKNSTWPMRSEMGNIEINCSIRSHSFRKFAKISEELTLNTSKRCLLCLNGKVAILLYPEPGELLNKRTEVITKCHCQNKFLLKNFNSHSWILL